MGLAPPRGHALWYAYILHRLSGLGLVLFLPLHFLVLSRALAGPDALDAALAWSDRPLVKMAETGLVFLLAVHAFGGLRLLALEWLPWSPRQKTFAAGAAAAAGFLSLMFLMRAVG